MTIQFKVVYIYLKISEPFLISGFLGNSKDLCKYHSTILLNEKQNLKNIVISINSDFVNVTRVLPPLPPHTYSFFLNSCLQLHGTYCLDEL